MRHPSKSGILYLSYKVRIVMKNSCATTCRQLGDVAKVYIQELGKKVQANPKLVLSLWPEIIGPHMAPMTRAISFDGSKLFVLVRNSTLLSLLHRKEDKARLMCAYKSKVPGLHIADIIFRLG